MAVGNRRLVVESESWPLARSFTISRGSKTAADVVVVTLEEGGAVGRGECVPYARYGESLQSVTAKIESLRGKLESGMSQQELQQAMPPGAARNAVDCALLDLDAKRQSKRAWELLGTSAEPVTTAYTVPYEDAATMAATAAENAWRPVLKIKLAGPDDLPRLTAVRGAAPESRLIVDANEGWSIDTFETIAPYLAGAGVVVVEQPVPAGSDSGLKADAYPFALCADESCHDRARLPDLVSHYDMINIKLDKTGGLTEALALKEMAQAAGLGIMVGCMVATSLAMAPAFLLAQGADYVDLDGPLLLRRDREAGVHYDGSSMQPPEKRLWG